MSELWAMIFYSLCIIPVLFLRYLSIVVSLAIKFCFRTAKVQKSHVHPPSDLPCPSIHTFSRPSLHVMGVAVRDHAWYRADFSLALHVRNRTHSSFRYVHTSVMVPTAITVCYVYSFCSPDYLPKLFSLLLLLPLL